MVYGNIISAHIKKNKKKKTEGTVTKMGPSHSSLSKKEKLALSSF